MATKVHRMEEDCEVIIRKYAPDGSITDGIRAMEAQIRDLRETVLTHGTKVPVYEIGGSTVPGVSNWTYPGTEVSETEDGMPKEYWKRLAKELERVIKVYAGER